MQLSAIFQLQILWQSVSLVEETGKPGENNHKTITLKVVSSTPHHELGLHDIP
jgi:hypothetical protein